MLYLYRKIMLKWMIILNETTMSNVDQNIEYVVTNKKAFAGILKLKYFGFKYSTQLDYVDSVEC